MQSKPHARPSSTTLKQRTYDNKLRWLMTLRRIYGSGRLTDCAANDHLLPSVRTYYLILRNILLPCDEVDLCTAPLTSHMTCPSLRPYRKIQPNLAI